MPTCCRLRAAGALVLLSALLVHSNPRRYRWVDHTDPDENEGARDEFRGGGGEFRRDGVLHKDEGGKREAEEVGQEEYFDEAPVRDPHDRRVQEVQERGQEEYMDEAPVREHREVEDNHSAQHPHLDSGQVSRNHRPGKGKGRPAARAASSPEMTLRFQNTRTNLCPHGTIFRADCRICYCIESVAGRVTLRCDSKFTRTECAGAGRHAHCDAHKLLYDYQERCEGTCACDEARNITTCQYLPCNDTLLWFHGYYEIGGNVDPNVHGNKGNESPDTGVGGGERPDLGEGKDKLSYGVGGDNKPDTGVVGGERPGSGGGDNKPIDGGAGSGWTDIVGGNDEPIDGGGGSGWTGWGGNKKPSTNGVGSGWTGPVGGDDEPIDGGGGSGWTGIGWGGNKKPCTSGAGSGWTGTVGGDNKPIDGGGGSGWTGWGGNKKPSTGGVGSGWTGNVGGHDEPSTSGVESGWTGNKWGGNKKASTGGGTTDSTDLTFTPQLSWTNGGSHHPSTTAKAKEAFWDGFDVVLKIDNGKYLFRYPDGREEAQMVVHVVPKRCKKRRRRRKRRHMSRETLSSSPPDDGTL